MVAPVYDVFISHAEADILPCAPEHGGWRRVESADGTPGYVHTRLLEPLQAE